MTEKKVRCPRVLAADDLPEVHKKKSELDFIMDRRYAPRFSLGCSLLI